MVELADKHLDVHAEYLNGNFTVQKSPRKFSLIAKDRSHKQTNKVFQGNGRASDLYDYKDAIALYILAGPDCVRIIEEFERVHKQLELSTGHHEEARSLQSRFLQDVQSFMKVVIAMGNPFLSTCQDLIALDTRAVMDEAVAVYLCQVHEFGQALHEE